MAAIDHGGHGPGAIALFGTSERFWLNLQSRFDLEAEKDRLGERLKKEVLRRAV